VKWLQAAVAPVELIFMDIQLADGSAFDIFKQTNIRIPVIFTTAYDQYALAAFREFSIDYLLKPITLPALSHAIEKLKALRQGQVSGQGQQTSHTPGALPDYQELTSRLLQRMIPYKSRFLAKLGQKFIFLETTDIAYFCAENKVVFVVTLDNRRLVADHTLEQLEKLLDPALFFRINRSIIIHVAAIEQVKPFMNSRLRVILKEAVKAEDIFISRERVVDFKKWADS